MAIPFVTHDVARALYDCTKKTSLDFNELNPIEQIEYIEQAEVAITTICKHINFLATHIDAGEMQNFVQSIMINLAKTLETKTHER